jgi:hypothetical protein
VKSVLLLAPRLPWPENSGGEIRVASPQVCEAMPEIVPGRHLLLGQDAAETADAAARVLEDAGLSRALAVA